MDEIEFEMRQYTEDGPNEVTQEEWDAWGNQPELPPTVATDDAPPMPGGDEIPF